MAGRIVLAIDDATVTWTTTLRYHRPATRPNGSLAGPFHRPVGGTLLASARRRLRARSRRAWRLVPSAPSHAGAGTDARSSR